MQLTITLAGATFRPAGTKDFIKESLHNDTQLSLEREATNQYDSNAVKIMARNSGDDPWNFLGYVPKTDNSVLAQFLDNTDEPAYTMELIGFAGTIQPMFTIDFSPEDDESALDDVEDTDDYENGGGPSD